MRVSTAIFIVSAIVFTANASPVPQEYTQQLRQSSTLGAMTNLFSSYKDFGSHVLSDTYNGVSTGVRNADETIGGFINEWNTFLFSR